MSALELQPLLDRPFSPFRISPPCWSHADYRAQNP